MGAGAVGAGEMVRGAGAGGSGFIISAMLPNVVSCDGDDGVLSEG